MIPSAWEERSSAMNRTVRWMGVGLVFVLCLGVGVAQAQQGPVPDDGSRGRLPVAAEPQAPSRTAQAPSEVVGALAVPRLIKFPGTFKDAPGKPLTNPQTPPPPTTTPHRPH